MNQTLNKLSENLLLAVKKGEDTNKIRNNLSKVSIESLQSQLTEDGSTEISGD